MSIESSIESVMREATSKIVQAVKQEIEAGVNAFAARLRGSESRETASPKPKKVEKVENGKTEKKPRAKRTSLDDGLVAQVLLFVRENPGQRSEEIQKTVGLPPGQVKKALVKLRGAGQLKTTGAKRATTYAAA